jgi:hypothetical protein
MDKLVFIPLLLLAALLNGCTSTLHVAGKRSELQRFDGGPTPVYVTNPEMTPEYQILKRSGIYRISIDPEGARPLTLHRMGPRFVCGNPLITTVFTLGLIPVKLPAPWIFQYKMETDGRSEEVEHFLPLYERFSIWEWPLKWDQQRVYARALAGSSPQQRPNKPIHSTPR